MKRREDERVENDDRKKEIDWNARMNDFARNLNDHYRQNTTLYKEERNIGNKEKIEDRFGLSNAYASKSGICILPVRRCIYQWHYRQRWKHYKRHHR